MWKTAERFTKPENMCLPLLKGNHFLLLKITRIGKKLHQVISDIRTPSAAERLVPSGGRAPGLELLSD